MRRFGLTILAILVVALAVWFVWWPPAESADELLIKARSAFADEQYEKANSLVQQFLTIDSDSPAALILAAEIAFSHEGPDKAFTYLSQLGTGCSAETVDANQRAAEAYLASGHAAEAETHLSRVLKCQPDHTAALHALGFLLAMEGRCWELRPLLERLSLDGRLFPQELILLADVWAPYDFPERTRFTEAVPTDPLPRLGSGRRLNATKQYAAAERDLKAIVAAYPNMVAAHAWAGVASLDAEGEAAPIPAWNAALPPGAQDHPAIWLVRGRWCELHGQPTAAARCFWEAVRRDPNYRNAVYHCGRLIAVTVSTEAAQPFQDRVQKLDRLTDLVHKVPSDIWKMGSDPIGMRNLQEIAILQMELGRMTESLNWCKIAEQLQPELPWISEMVGRLLPIIAAHKEQNVEAPNPAQQITLSDFPLPDFSTANATTASLAVTEFPASPQFVDLARATRLRFQYYNAPEPSSDGMRALESTGGGIGVLDFDGDWWPDVYFTQGSRWPEHRKQTAFLDTLFRNTGNGSFTETPPHCGLSDDRFSQGVSVGDFNNDGFPDLYVANIGGNRLYQNNGDGTFTDISEKALVGGTVWTTSCLIADLNGDTLPDLYDANYFEGESSLTRMCVEDGVARVCHPSEFASERDRLWINRGDGTFSSDTDQLSNQGMGGKGLGLIAADFSGTGHLDLFVANDTTANFFYRSAGHTNKGPHLVERAMLSGLAFDDSGNAQACMGVAVDDADGDGDLDLFVTNFFEEWNTLYLQQSSGDWYRDESARRGLRDATLAYLGFGTQFVDAELDGWPDLVVANGHVDDYSHKGDPFKMRPQFFRNRGDAFFQELPGDALGPYFESTHLGRAMARTDWNRDGRDDLIISHLGSPVALVTNHTERVGHCLIVHLRSVASARDAIGTRVTLHAGERHWTRQLTAGDGYQASNRRSLTFGLGMSAQIDQLTVHWPSGREQTFSEVPIDSEVLLIEDKPELVVRTAAAKLLAARMSADHKAP